MNPNDPNKVYSILYVEDDPVAFAQTAKLLTKMGYFLYVAENGQEGLRIYQEAKPDIVLTDTDMPVMNGLEMARQIRALNKKAQIVVTTVPGDVELLLNSFEIGINYYVLKPVDYNKLAAALDKCVDGLEKERKLTEQTERLSVLSTALEQSPSMVVITDLSGTVEYVNPKFTEITGYTANEINGQNIRILKSGKTNADIYKVLWSTIIAGREWRGELVNRTKDGSEYLERIKISPLYNPSGQIVKFIKVAEDITKRKKTEEEIRQLNAELEYKVIRRTALLEAANRELDEFCDAVSHELLGPLSRLQGLTYALNEDCAENLDSQGKLYVQRIDQASKQLKHILDTLLDLTQLTRRGIAQQDVNLSSIAHSITEELLKNKPERQVEFFIAPDVVVKGDPGLLKIVMENLLKNAWKATDKHATARIEFGLAKAEGKSVYFVRDDGAGFDMKYVHKLFKLFQRIHQPEDSPGTGIELASVQRIIQRHSGRIWAEGEVEKGATFYFTLG